MERTLKGHGVVPIVSTAEGRMTGGIDPEGRVLPLPLILFEFERLSVDDGRVRKITVIG